MSNQTPWALFPPFPNCPGLPTLVARRMLKETDGVIARLVKNSQDAKTAAAEGANLVLLEVSVLGLWLLQKQDDKQDGTLRLAKQDCFKACNPSVC